MAVLTRKNNPEARMSLGEHFKEFRNRTLIAVVAICIAGIFAWLKYDVKHPDGSHTGIWPWLQRPILEVALKHPGQQIAPNFTSMTDAFGVKLKVSLWAGLIISSPVWLWEIWAFLAPGLTGKEKKVGVGFIFTAVPLFLAGCWVSTLVMQNAVGFLLGVTPSGATNLFSAQEYLTFVTKFILAFGFAFLLPVFLVALNMARVFPGRVMLKGWRIAVMVIGVFAAMMSPTPDAWSMLALMAPMIVLYFAACGIALLMDKRRNGNRPEWLDVPDDERSSL